MTSLNEIILGNQYQLLGKHFYSSAKPEGLSHPELIKYNDAVAEDIGLSSDEGKTDTFMQAFSGNQLLKGSKPIAQSYMGHQFGRFNPFMGDGRSILLGDIESKSGRLELSIKGSGKTPYTFVADGRAGINECLKEYVVSERLAENNVPTTRCLSIIAGDDQVYRSGFENAAIVTRVAPSYIRFGTFESCFYRKDIEGLRRLSRYVIQHYYPECWVEKNERKSISHLFERVVINTANLIARWQSIGFVHGTMNTDNQSILGIAMDLDGAEFTANFDDSYVVGHHVAKDVDQHRYAFGNQPTIGLWNCNVLGKALSPLIEKDEIIKSLKMYEACYLKSYKQLT